MKEGVDSRIVSNRVGVRKLSEPSTSPSPPIASLGSVVCGLSSVVGRGMVPPPSYFPKVAQRKKRKKERKKNEMRVDVCSSHR
jgi:hypothetical protein